MYKLNFSCTTYYLKIKEKEFKVHQKKKKIKYQVLFKH